MIPEELWMTLENGGRKCEQCGRRFFGMGVRGRVMRTIRFNTNSYLGVQQKKWMLDVVCCDARCFDMARKDE